MLRPIQTLPLPSATISKLSDEGYRYYEDLFDHNRSIKKEVKQLLQFTYESSVDICDLIKLPVQTSAFDIYQTELKSQKIITFCQALDRILGGGIFLGELTELCGASGSGKTQICLQLCAAVQLPRCLGGLQGEAVYVDTDRGFTPARLKDVVKSCSGLLSNVSREQDLPSAAVADITTSKLLHGVHYIDIDDCNGLVAICALIEEMLIKHPQVKLVVIDCITFPLLDPAVSNTLSRTRHVCGVVKQLQNFAVKYNVAVIVTNQLTTKFINQNAKLAPALSENYSHAISKRIILGEVGDRKFSAAVYKCSYLDEESCEFEISGDGVRDPSLE